MPSKLKAGGTFRYVLEGDRQDSPNDVFHLRILSCDEHDQLTELRLQYFKSDDAEATIDAMLAIAVASWDVPAAGDQPLKSFLTARECFELIAAAISGTMLTEEERKKQESLHLSAIKSSATDAVPASAATV